MDLVLGKFRSMQSRVAEGQQLAKNTGKARVSAEVSKEDTLGRKRVKLKD